MRRHFDLHADPRGVFATVAGLLLLAIGALSFTALVMPHPETGNLGALIAVDAVAFVAGLACLVAGGRFPRGLMHPALALASLLICLSIWATGLAVGLYSMMFAWVALSAAYVFPWRAAIGQCVWLLGCHGAALSLVVDPSGFSLLTRWLLTAMSVLGVASLTAWLVASRRRAMERADHFFALSRDLLCTTDPEGRLVEVNQAWTEALGWNREELRGHLFTEFVHPDDIARTEDEAGRANEGRASTDFDNRYLAKDGSWHWLRWASAMSPETGLIYARATDVTDAKRLAAEREQLVDELARQARTDAMTGAPNRRWLGEELGRAMARARRDGSEVCLAMLDLDHFKRFNDEHGHVAGDLLLRDAVEGWRGALRLEDFLARFGGEEFAVILTGCSAGEARSVIRRLRARTPRGQTFSAGIAAWDGAEDSDALTARADTALYAAKQAGRDAIRLAPADVRAV